MTTQRRNAEMVNLLRADFQARYEPNFALGNVLSLYMDMPAMRAFWPCTSVIETGNLYDVSGQNRILTQVNTPVFNNYGLVSYANFNGNNQYFTRADENGLDFLGTEAYMAAVLRGLTVTCWVRVNAYGAGVSGLIAKYTSGNNANSNFVLGAFANNLYWYVMSGANLYVTNSALSTGQWAFVCARYDPSTIIQLTINETTAFNNVAIPAALNNSTAPLDIGLASVNQYLNGDMTLIALYAAYLTDAQVNVLYEQSRSLFGI